MVKALSTIAVLLISVEIGASTTSDDQCPWFYEVALAPLNAVTSTTTGFTAVGDSGLVVSSADGESWHLEKSAIGTKLNDVAASESALVAVGDGGMIMSRSGTESWQPVESPTTADLMSVTWTGTEFIAVGQRGSVVVSSSGISWLQRAVGVDFDLTSIASDGRTTVAAGNGDAPTVLVVETDGSWTQIAVPDPCDNAPGVSCVPAPLKVAAGCDHFFLLGGWHNRFNARSWVKSSDDGRIWVDLPWPQCSPGPEEPWLNPHRGAVCDSGTLTTLFTYGGAATAPFPGQVDQVECVDLPVNAALPLGDIARRSGHDVAVGSAAHLFFAGVDGWRTTPLDLGPAASDGTSLVLLERRSSLGLRQSRWGSTWTLIDVAVPEGLNALSWTGDEFLAVGDAGCIASSRDGLTWTTTPSLVTVPLRGAASSPSEEVAVGDDGSVLSRPWRGSWHMESPSTHLDLLDVTWAGTRFVAVGDGVVTERRGRDSVWTTTEVSGRLRSVAASYSEVVAVGDDGLALVSRAEGIWTAIDTGLGGLRSVIWDGRRFMAGGDGGVIATSDDGDHWEALDSPITSDINELLWVGLRPVFLTHNGFPTWADCLRSKRSIEWPGAGLELVPAVASVPGAESTPWWRSELLSGHAAAAFVLPAETDNRGAEQSPLCHEQTTDLYRCMAGESGSGAAAFAGSGPFLTRVFARTDSGEVGQLMPGLGRRHLLRAGDVGILAGLQESIDFRTNLGLASLSSQQSRIAVSLFSATGQLLWTSIVPLPPFGNTKLNRILESAGVGAVVGAWARVEATDPADLLAAWASIVDNRSGDPSLVLPARIHDPNQISAPTGDLVSLTPGSEWWIPAVGSGPGLEGTLWRTDLEVVNPGPQTARFRVRFLPRRFATSEPVDLELVLEPGHGLTYQDVVQIMTGGTPASGALSVVVAHGEIVVTSRTSNVTPHGTFGQVIPVSSYANSIRADRPGLIPIVRYSESDRVNVGLLNITDQPVDTEIVFRVDNEARLSRHVSLAPFEPWHLSNVRVPGADTFSGDAAVTVTTPDGAVLAYASLVDGGTGDAVYIPGSAARGRDDP